MQFYKCVLLCAVLALSILEPTTARKGFGSGGSRHSYPKSPGLSGGGGGSHGYPSSGGFSGGGGGNHGYPSSGGLSGGGRGYPSSQGGSHNYPASTGLSGNTGSRGYQPSGGSHTYPGSGSNHGYPSSGGMSGNNNRGSGSTTNIHHHYHYSPPQSITYTPTRGAPAVSYPVYRGTPPTYVYQYKDSGSKYGTLLAGLALLNLGTLAAGTAYAVSHSHNSGSGSGSGNSYRPQNGEVCKFGLRKENGDYEETRIDCQLISSFILAEEAKTQGAAQQNSTSITQTVTVVNTTTINNNNPVEQTPAANQTTKILYEMRPDGSLVPVNITVNATTAAPPTANNSMTSTVTVTNTTVTNAVDVKGKPVEVTAGMKCYVIRTTPISNMKKNVPCQLLQTYADQSLKKNSATRSLPTFTIITAVLAAFIVM